MKKIISLFQRNYDGDHLVRDEVVPGAEWVVAGEGYPTRKWDGTCCMISEGLLFKRREVKNGRKYPPGFNLADFDPVTGNTVGWVPVGDGPEDKWHREAFDTTARLPWADGTYELVGPSINGNPENVAAHCLLRHGRFKWIDTGLPPRDYNGLIDFFSRISIEGIVWHHPDGRMVKIKAKDFGIQWPVKDEGMDKQGTKD